jgi:hypothetical protein
MWSVLVIFEPQMPACYRIDRQSLGVGTLVLHMDNIPEYECLDMLTLMTRGGVDDRLQTISTDMVAYPTKVRTFGGDRLGPIENPRGITMEEAFRATFTTLYSPFRSLQISIRNTIGSKYTKARTNFYLIRR